MKEPRKTGWKRARADLGAKTEVMPDHPEPLLVIDSLAARVHLRAAELGWSMGDLARSLGYHHGALSSLLYRRRLPERFVRKLSRSLRMSLEDWADPEPLRGFRGQERRIWGQMRVALAKRFGKI
jgi:hypothetical protein